MKNPNQCPVCGYVMPYPPDDDNICPSCGTHFGYHNYDTSFGDLRVRWLRAGAPWFDKAVPPASSWNGLKQVIDAGLIGEEAEGIKAKAGNLTPKRTPMRFNTSDFAVLATARGGGH